jgi:uncharacterized protein YndB with AHSA1/START domain
MDVRFQVQTEILRPVAAVFDAVVNPAKLSGYFIKSSTGPLVLGSTVIWKFPEFPVETPVTVTALEPNRRLVLTWSGGQTYDTQVEMTFEPLAAARTLVKIAETGWTPDEGGLKLAQGNCMGWTHMSTSLKAYVEFGINLRAGAFSTELIEKEMGLRAT